MQRLEVSGAVRPIYGSLGVKGLNAKYIYIYIIIFQFKKAYLIIIYKARSDAVLFIIQIIKFVFIPAALSIPCTKFQSPGRLPPSDFRGLVFGFF